jgi:hypothetical protein
VAISKPSQILIDLKIKNQQFSYQFFGYMYDFFLLDVVSNAQPNMVLTSKEHDGKSNGLSSLCICPSICCVL